MKIDDIYSLFSRSSGISTDTRTIKSKNLFFCLKGKNFNGNLFIDQAISLGASFVIYDEEKLNHKSKRAFKVKNALETLQALAKHHRSKFNIPGIGLTGSNGKTTSKELINSVLSQKFNVTYKHVEMALIITTLILGAAVVYMYSRNIVEGRYVYDVNIVSAGSTYYKLVKGDIMVHAGVSTTP